jgi:hypothetical protein
MKKILVISCLMLLFFSVQLQADKYAGEIFQMGAGVRNFAMGNCGVSDPASSGLAYWNAALLSEVSNTKFELMHAEEYMGLLTYDTFSAIWGNKYKLSAVLTRIGIDDIPLSKLSDPGEPVSFENRPYEYKSVNNSDLVLYLGFARKFGKYNIGFTPKFAYRNLAEESGFGFGADISTYFRFKELLLGIKIRDFFTTQILWGNGTHELVNPSLDLEANYAFQFPIISRNAKFFTRFEVFTEGREEAAVLAINPLSMDPHFGLEIDLHQSADLFLGYDVKNLTSGLSVHYRNWMINYGFELNTELENSHRISLNYII